MKTKSWWRPGAGLLVTVLTWSLGATAVSGQPAPAASTLPPAQILATTLSSHPPALQAIGPQAGYGDLLVLGRGARFELADAADAAHVPVIDGQQVTVAALAGPWQPGRHAVSLQPVVAPGEQPAMPAPLQFVYDNTAPNLTWEVGDTGLLDSYGLDQGVDRDRPPRHVVPERDRRVKILWSPDGRRWIPLLPKNAQADARGVLADWLTAADRPQVFLWALGDQVFGDDAPVAPKKLQLVRIWAGDELSAVRDLRMRVLPAPSGYLLEMVATDLVGNVTTVTWPVAR
jgi:hypothetical protein